MDPKRAPGGGELGGLSRGKAAIQAYVRASSILPECARRAKLWLMKLRLDLLEHLTAADILHEAAANQHRYKAEPSFSKTGVGHLSPRSTTDSASEAARSQALTRKLTRRLRANGKRAGRPS